MCILNYIPKRILFLLTGIIILGFLNSCGIYKPSDARIVSPNSQERVKKNLEEGKGISLKKMMDGGGSGTNYQFASSNPMWRATLEILDFLPLSNVDYSGGIIITDWFSENSEQDPLKITIRFLSTEIRADGLKVIIYKKVCKKNDKSNCQTIQDNTTLGQEIKLAILKKAATIENSEISKSQKDYTERGAGMTND